MELSVVMPVKGNRDSVVHAVRSLLEQDLDAPLEVVVVVDDDDPARGALRVLEPDSRLRVVQPPPFPIAGGRDANWRRCVGVDRSTGRAIAFVDADMVFDPTWARRGLALLESSDCVGGVVRSVDGLGFWGRYIDRNNIAAKTPRFDRRRDLDAATLGRRGRKPPITANLFVRREVVERVGPPRPDITFNYDDYAFCQDIVDAGFGITCAPELDGHHEHRQGLRALLHEYDYSGRGCAQFARAYPRSILARRRSRHVLVLLTVVLMGCAGLLLAPLWVVGVGLAALLVLSVLQVVSVRSVEAAVYPLVTLGLGAAFARGFVRERLWGVPLDVAWTTPVPHPVTVQDVVAIDLVAEAIADAPRAAPERRRSHLTRRSGRPTSSAHSDM
jgi:GT2 family glycosyltransferase